MLALALLASLAVGMMQTFGGTVPGVEAAQDDQRVPAGVGAAYFVDCAATSPGTGTQERPFTSLAQASSIVLQHGDRLLFKRGSTCHGTLAPQGSGEMGSPIIIGAYGTGDARPVIAGDGEVTEAVTLFNEQYIDIRDLEITNTEADPADRYTAYRFGLVVRLMDYGQGNYYRVSNLYVHDVYGIDDGGYNGGIYFVVETSDDASERVETNFNDVVIANNQIVDVAQMGINMSTPWLCRPEVGTCDGLALPFVPWTGMLITGNHIERTYRDAMIVQMNVDALVEHNVVIDSTFARVGGAAMWTWDSDDTVFQYNEVSGSGKPATYGDGTAFDADYGTTGTLYQFNYSHENEGGMALGCGCWQNAVAGSAVFRYNLSENDGLTRTNFIANTTGAEFYNNTFVLPDRAMLLNDLDDGDSSVLYANNLFIAQAPVSDDFAEGSGEAVYRANAFSGPGGGWPAQSGGVLIPPTLPLAPGDGTDRFKISNPQLAGGGIPFAEAGLTDYFGNPVPSTCAPDIGAFQFSMVQDDCDPGPIDLAAGGTATFPVHPDTTYRATAALGSGVSLSVVNPKGFVTPAQYDGAVVFQTAMDATSVTVQCAGGDCSGVRIDPILNQIRVDPSFESPAGTRPWLGPDSDEGQVSSRTTQAAFVVSGSGALQLDGQTFADYEAVNVLPNASYLLTGWAAASSGTTSIRVLDGSTELLHLDTTSQMMSHLYGVFQNGGGSRLTVECRYSNAAGYGNCDDISVTALAAPSVAQQPVDTTISQGDSGYFSVRFQDAPRSPMIWQQLTEAGWVDIPGASGTTLTVPPGAADGTQYRAVLHTPTLDVVSAAATLHVILDEATQAVLDQIDALPAVISTWADADLVAAATNGYSALGSAQSQIPAAYVTKLADAQLQSKVVNRTTRADQDSTDPDHPVTVSPLTDASDAALPWNIRIHATPAWDPSDPAWSDYAATLPADQTLLLLTDLEFFDTLTGQVVQPAVAVRVTMDGLDILDGQQGLQLLRRGLDTTDTISMTVDGSGAHTTATFESDALGSFAIVAAIGTSGLIVFIQKTAEDEAGNWVGMSGSGWQVLLDNDGSPGGNAAGVAITGVAGVTGLFQVEGLASGAPYWLMETLAPEGFTLLAQPVQFTVASSGAVTLGPGSGNSVRVAAGTGTQAPWYVLTVRDVPNAYLPASGGNGNEAVVLTGSMLLTVGMALFAGIAWRRRRPGATREVI